MTRKEVDEIKGHFDAVAGGLRTELRAEITGFRQELGDRISGVQQELGDRITGSREELGDRITGLQQELAAQNDETRRHVGVVAEDLRSEIRLVADGVALANERIDHLDLRVDGLTGEVRRGFAGLRAEIRGLHETDDELRQRIEAQERRGA